MLVLCGTGSIGAAVFNRTAWRPVRHGVPQGIVQSHGLGHGFLMMTEQGLAQGLPQPPGFTVAQVAHVTVFFTAGRQGVVHGAPQSQGLLHGFVTRRGHALCMV